MKSNALITQDESSQYYSQNPETSVCVGVAILNALIFYIKKNRIAKSKEIDNFIKNEFIEDGAKYFERTIGKLDKILSCYRIPASLDSVKDEIEKGFCVYAATSGHAYLIIDVDGKDSITVVNYSSEKSDSVGVVEKIHWDDLRFIFTEKSYSNKWGDVVGDSNDKKWGNSSYIHFHALFPLSELSNEIMKHIRDVQEKFSSLGRVELRSPWHDAKQFDERIRESLCFAILGKWNDKRFCRNKSLKNGLFCRFHCDFVENKVVPDREKSKKFSLTFKRREKIYDKKVIELEKKGFSCREIRLIMRKFILDRKKRRKKRERNKAKKDKFS